MGSEMCIRDSYVSEIMPNIIKAVKLPLAEEYESAIIDAFTT